MKKREPQNLYPPQAQAPQQSQSALDEAQAMFERMKGEVICQSEREHKDNHSQGPIARLLLTLTITACLLAAATMLYGIYNFPDAPIRQTDGRYIGKGGKPHTQDDFEGFILWRKSMLMVVPSIFVIGFAFGITDSIQRRKRRS